MTLRAARSHPRGPGGTRREQQKAETQALILDAARALFEAEGFKGTTMRALAAAAGVGLGTICAHFPDKESLLVAVLVDDLEYIQREFIATVPEQGPLEEQLLHMATAGYTFWGKRPALSRVLLKEMWFLEGRWAERMRALERRALEVTVALVRAAQQRGELRADIDPLLVARAGFSFYLTTILGALDAAERDLDLDAMVEDTRRLLRMMMRGIGAHP